MPDELNPCPFERSIEGLRGTVLLRRNHDHVEHIRRVFRRRPIPAWRTDYADAEVQP